MKQIEKDLLSAINNYKITDSDAIDKLIEAKNMFDSLIQIGVVNKRGNKLATESVMCDDSIVFNR